MSLEQTNPFLENLILEVRFIKSKHTAYSSVRDDDIKHPVEEFSYKKNKLVEIDRSVKVYVIETFEDILPHLKVNSLRIWMYVERHLAPNQDFIELKASYFKEIYDISTSTFYNAIGELTVANLINKRKTRKDTYWVNIKYVFNGNRIKFIKEIDESKIKYIS